MLKRGQTGRVTEIPSAADIREATGLSQARFAHLLGVSARTLQGMGTGAPRTFGCSANAAVDGPSQSKGASRGGSGFDRPGLSNPQGVTKSTVGK
jgi:hypothetical protein